MIQLAGHYGRKIPKTVIFATGVLTLSSAAYGLYLTFTGFVALRATFPAIAQQLEYFYPAFYLMLSVNIACCLVLAWCGLDQLCLRFDRLKLFVELFIFEILYLAFVFGVLMHLPSINMSIAAASAAAIGGLMPQFRILLPLWAPFTLAWAKKRLTYIAVEPTEALPKLPAEHSETSLIRTMRRQFLIALVGGVGAGISFFLVVSVAMSFDTLTKRFSVFTFHLVAFFLAGLCATYSATLDSSISLRMPGYHYVAIILVVLASYFGASLWLHNQLVLSLFPMALIIGIILNGFSLRAMRSSLWAFVGSVVGIVTLAVGLQTFAALSDTAISVVYVEHLLDSPGISFIRHGLTWYGFSLGLLLSCAKREERSLK